MFIVKLLLIMNGYNVPDDWRPVPRRGKVVLLPPAPKLQYKG
jgi:hypothetical protein